MCISSDYICMYDSKEYQKKRRQLWIEDGLCSRCGKSPPDPGVKNCSDCRAYAKKRAQFELSDPEFRQKRDNNLKKWRQENPDKARALSRRAYDKKKTQVFDHYGWKCSCCGEETPEFLCIDHINNDGNVQRAFHKGNNTYHHIIKAGFPDDLQTLCFNCNMGKHICGGVCPCKKKK